MIVKFTRANIFFVHFPFYVAEWEDIENEVKDGTEY